MLLKSSLIISLAVVFQLPLTPMAWGKSASLNPKMVQSLHKIADLYRLNDCAGNFSKDTGKHLVSACAEAFENPEIESSKGNVSCYYDLDIFHVTAESNSVTPEYVIKTSGEITRIVKGNLSVASNSCKMLYGAKRLPASEVQPANEDLCLSFFPDGQFSKYQEKSDCAEEKSKGDAQSSNSIDEEDEDEDYMIAGL